MKIYCETNCSLVLLPLNKQSDNQKNTLTLNVYDNDIISWNEKLLKNETS